MSASAELVVQQRRRSPVSTIASWEFRASVRSRWTVVMAVVFATLCLGVTSLGLATIRELGLRGIGPAAATLVNLGVLLPSLTGLLLGAGTLVGAKERGVLAMMAAQPISRGAIVAGTFFGLSASTWTTLGIGYGVALLVMSAVARTSDVPAVVALIGASLLVATASVAIGVALSSMASSRVQALAGATSLWILFALGIDLALAALAPSVHIGPRALLGAILLNPLEAGRVLALLGTDLRGSALGPFGAYLVGSFGAVGAVAILVVDLVGWTLIPLAIARSVLRRRDL